MRLADATWREVEHGGILVLPVGATEQHGPHLPIGTDIRIVDALVCELEAAFPEAWMAPTLAVGASGEHAGFPGTLSMGSGSLAGSLLEIVRSADHFDGVFVVNWHGGNAAAIAAAVERASREGRTVASWTPPRDPAERAREADLHAGRVETSLMLAIAPEMVHLRRAEAGPPVPSTELRSRLRAEGVRAVSANGVIGDPAGATADEGTRILGTLTASLIAGFEEFEAGSGG